MKLDEMLAKMSAPYPPMEIDIESTALVLIDMQVLAAPEHVVETAVASGIDRSDAENAILDYTRRFESATTNAKKLLEACRKKGIRPIHVRIQSYTNDAHDTGPLHKRIGFFCPPGDRWSAWLPDVKPILGETELIKTCSGAVVGTMIERVMKNMGIKKVIAVGFYTDQCVETTVRDLADCGFEVTMVLDATATETEKRQNNTIENIVNVYCGGENTEALLSRIEYL